MSDQTADEFLKRLRGGAGEEAKTADGFLSKMRGEAPPAVSEPPPSPPAA